MSEYLTKEEIRKWRSSLERITLEEYAARLGKVIQEEKHDDSLVDSVMFRSLNTADDENYIPKAEKIQMKSVRNTAKEKEPLSVKIEKSSAAETAKETNILKAEKQNEDENSPSADILNLQDKLKKIEPAKKNAAPKAERKTIDKAAELKSANSASKLPKTEQAKTKTSETFKKTEKIKKTAKQAAEQVSADKIKNKKDAGSISFNYSFNRALTEREQIVFEHFAANINTVVYAKDLAEILSLPRDYVYKYIKNLRNKLNDDILQNSGSGGYILKVKA